MQQSVAECLKKMDKELLKRMQMSVIIGISLFAAFFYWNFDHNIELTIIFTGCFVLFELVTCPSIQNGD